MWARPIRAAATSQVPFRSPPEIDPEIHERRPHLVPEGVPKARVDAPGRRNPPVGVDGDVGDGESFRFVVRIKEAEASGRPNREPVLESREINGKEPSIALRSRAVQVVNGQVDLGTGEDKKPPSRGA